ncbi:MAG: hypothetical protein GF334_02660 [Candidatus Altiarchaeales archaeon]|nr:hypothetical protein [Candidatus Altiarchaeales archaeon]
MEEIEFFDDRALDEEFVTSIKEAFIDRVIDGFLDECDIEVEVLWLPEEGLCKISSEALDSWDEDELKDLLEDCFLYAVEDAAKTLEDEDRYSDAVLVRGIYKE